MIVIKEYNITKSLDDYFRDKNISLDRQKELTFLDCANNQLTSLEGIENCTKLKTLYCDNNKLISLKGIENLTKLRWLSCHNNKLISLKEIENLTQLEWMHCDDLEDIIQYKDKIENININL
jgi:Leucine-rich repeat (LRR) protein